MTRYFTAIVVALTTGCSLPPNQAVPDHSLFINADHWLSNEQNEQNKDHTLTAYVPLEDAFMSIASRLYLIRNAKHHLDLQYYMWNDDFVGQMMLIELLAAADRGVKVRLLVDDQNGTQLDAYFKALEQHPNFDIKIFNPYKYRNFRALDYLLRATSINHRMHNKLIIADGAIAVTGGRNISSEYFDASNEFQFTDMDILFYGESIKQANQIFANFWNHELSYSTTQWIDSNDHDDLKSLRLKFNILKTDQNEDMAQSKIQAAHHMLHAKLNHHQIRWSKATFLADDPEKARGKATQEGMLYRQMKQTMGQPKQQLDLVSAYFVPMKLGEDNLTQFAQNGAKVRVLTNSFVANDVAIVHAYYQKYRKALLRDGVKLYEFKPYLERPDKTWYEVATGNLISKKGKNASSLHAKFFSVDGKVFIGSFNFDPRSAHLNTEVGLVVESEELQRHIAALLDDYLDQIAYEVQLDKRGNLIWIEHTASGQIIVHTREPQVSRFQNLLINIVVLLPFESLM